MWAVRANEVNRKCTNISSLYFSAAFIIITLIFAIYNAKISNLDRLIQGYDDCGNVCGLKNDGNPFDQCGPNDKQNEPKVEVDSKRINNATILHYKCVPKCQKGYVEVFNRCWKSSSENSSTTEGMTFFQVISQQLMQTYPYLVLVCGIAFFFSFVVLILIRFFIEYIIWIISILFVVLIGCSAVGCWIFYVTTKQADKGGILFIACMFTLGFILSILGLILSRKRIKLVAQIFKEASTAIVDVPMMLLEPIAAFFVFLIAFLIFSYFALATETAGELKAGKAADGEFQATFESTFTIYMARFLNVFAFIWFTQFIAGCQNFVIAGTVSKWYFTRDKSKLESPIITTFVHLIRFHLGSICLGSMLIALVKIVKMIVNAIREQTRSSTSVTAQVIGCLCSCLIEKLDQLLQYLIRNAYIIMAKDGTPFFESGKKAFNLLFKNLKNVMTLNSFGDLVLFMGRLFVVLIAGLCGYVLMSKSGTLNIFPMILAVTISYFIANCFISVFEMTIDTIFVCYCEDMEENDGIIQPYFMSHGLKAAMDGLKEASERKYFKIGRQVGVENGNRRF